MGAFRVEGLCDERRLENVSRRLDRERMGGRALVGGDRVRGLPALALEPPEQGPGRGVLGCDGDRAFGPGEGRRRLARLGEGRGEPEVVRHLRCRIVPITPASEGLREGVARAGLFLEQGEGALVMGRQAPESGGLLIGGNCVEYAIGGGRVKRRQPKQDRRAPPALFLAIARQRELAAVQGDRLDGFALGLLHRDEGGQGDAVPRIELEGSLIGEAGIVGRCEALPRHLAELEREGPSIPARKGGAEGQLIAQGFRQRRIVSQPLGTTPAAADGLGRELRVALRCTIGGAGRLPVRLLLFAKHRELEPVAGGSVAGAEEIREPRNQLAVLARASEQVVQSLLDPHRYAVAGEALVVAQLADSRQRTLGIAEHPVEHAADLFAQEALIVERRVVAKLGVGLDQEQLTLGDGGPFFFSPARAECDGEHAEMMELLVGRIAGCSHVGAQMGEGALGLREGSAVKLGQLLAQLDSGASRERRHPLLEDRGSLERPTEGGEQPVELGQDAGAVRAERRRERCLIGEDGPAGRVKHLLEERRAFELQRELERGIGVQAELCVEGAQGGFESAGLAVHGGETCPERGISGAFGAQAGQPRKPGVGTELRSGEGNALFEQGAALFPADAFGLGG